MIELAILILFAWAALLAWSCFVDTITGIWSGPGHLAMLSKRAGLAGLFAGAVAWLYGQGLLRLDLPVIVAAVFIGLAWLLSDSRKRKAP